MNAQFIDYAISNPQQQRTPKTLFEKHYELGFNTVVFVPGAKDKFNYTNVNYFLGLRIAGKIADFAELENQPVRTLADGSTIKIKDVSRIVTAAKETEVINLLNGTPSIGLFICKQTGSNTVDASEKVREELTRM